MKILSIVGARPQFIKLAPLVDKLKGKHESVILHTGQHYNPEMSQLIFDQLNIPEPDYNLEVGSHTQGKQTGLMLEGIEKVLLKERPDIVVVFGDTNSTIAGVLAAVKLHIKTAHVEAGLRSFNRAMPEEINRVMTDHCSDVLFAPTDVAVKNLVNEGIVSNVFLVGDIMYDSILRNMSIAEKKSAIIDDLDLKNESYSVLTLHRQENTDTVENLVRIINGLIRSNENIIFPIHPRTVKYLKECSLMEKINGSNIRMIDPLGYLDFLLLMKNASKIITDSGGIQKEAYFMRKPCITLRNETEWIETVEDGWNILVGADEDRIVNALNDFDPKGSIKDFYGDGTCAEKIVTILNSR